MRDEALREATRSGKAVDTSPESAAAVGAAMREGLSCRVLVKLVDDREKLVGTVLFDVGDFTELCALLRSMPAETEESMRRLCEQAAAEAAPAQEQPPHRGGRGRGRSRERNENDNGEGNSSAKLKPLPAPLPAPPPAATASAPDILAMAMQVRHRCLSLVRKPVPVPCRRRAV